MRSVKTGNNEIFGGIATDVIPSVPRLALDSHKLSSESSKSTLLSNNVKRKLFLKKLPSQLIPKSTLPIIEQLKLNKFDDIKEFNDILDSAMTTTTIPDVSDKNLIETSIKTAITTIETTPVMMNKSKKKLSDNKDRKNLMKTASSSLLLDSVCNGSSSSEWIDQTSSSPSNPSENSIEGSYTDRSTKKQNNFITKNHIKNINSNTINTNINITNISNNMEEEDDDGNDSEQELPSLTWLTRLAVTMFTNPPILDNDADDNFNGNNCLSGSNNTRIISNGTTGVNNNNNINNNNSNNNGNGKSLGTNQNSTNNNGQQRKEDTLMERYNKFMEQVKVSQDKYYKEEEYYLNNDVDKPIFNYATIIAMAMLENGRMTLQEICTWIEQKFKYYRGKKKWNNSIRHNLSLQYCFRKINRDKFEKGKGGYWELGMDISKGERKRIRNKKSQVANINNATTNNSNKKLINNDNGSKSRKNNCNTNYNNNGSISSSSSSMSSSSSLSPLIPEKRRKITHQNNNNNYVSILSTASSTSSIITTAAIAAGLEHQNHNDNELSSSSSVNSLERIIFDVLENSDDITSSYHQQQHDYSQQHQLISNGTNELDVDHETIITSAVTNFLNHHHITDDNGDYCLIDNNLDVFEQTLQHINEQNNNNGCNNCNIMDDDLHTETSFNTRPCNNCNNLGNSYIINTDGTIIANDRTENYITIDTSNLQTQQQQEQHQLHHQQHQHHHSNIGNSNGSTIDITDSIVQISTNDECFGQIVEIASNGDSFLNLNDLNDVDVMSSNNSTAIITTSTQQTQTTSSSEATTTADIFDEELGTVGTMVDPTTMEAQTHPIYSPQQNESQVPESCEDIVASVLNNYRCNGPSVVVEPIPSYNNNNNNDTASNITNCNMNNSNSNTSAIIMNDNSSVISDNSIIIADDNNRTTSIYDKNLSTIISTIERSADLSRTVTVTSATTTAAKAAAVIEIAKSTLIPSIRAAVETLVTTPTPVTAQNTAVITDETAAREAAIAAAIISSTNFHEEIDEEFNFFKYTDDVVDRHNDDVDLFPFDSIASHEF